jgi:hypothetical protein
MLYKFKSKTTGDLIMLEPNGRQMLKIMGKGDADNLVKGILEPHDMPAAAAALEQAARQEDEARAAAHAITQAETGQKEESVAGATVSLRQRAKPLLDMIRRCQTANTPIVWGV